MANQERQLSRAEKQRWCMDRNIVITFEAIDNYTGRIQINNRGKIKLGDIVYRTKKRRVRDPKWWESMMNLYEHYYDHYIQYSKEEVPTAGPDIDDGKSLFQVLVDELTEISPEMYSKLKQQQDERKKEANKK